MPALSRNALLLALVAVLAACASARGGMDEMLDEQIGKPADDPSGFRALNEKRRVYASRARNGKIQEEYLLGFRDNCRVFLTVDDQARKIVDWRYEGSDADCVSPNIGR